MAEVQATLVTLKGEKLKSTNLATVVSEYDTMINRQNLLNLSAHAFWTTNSVVEPITGVSFEYKDLKLEPQTKEWIHSCSNGLG